MSNTQNNRKVGQKSKNEYEGAHRYGLWLVPLGDRHRVKPNEIHLVGNAEEVDSVDNYSKYLK